MAITIDVNQNAVNNFIELICESGLINKNKCRNQSGYLTIHDETLEICNQNDRNTKVDITITDNGTSKRYTCYYNRLYLRKMFNVDFGGPILPINENNLTAEQLQFINQLTERYNLTYYERNIAYNQITMGDTNEQIEQSVLQCINDYNEADFSQYSMVYPEQFCSIDKCNIIISNTGYWTELTPEDIRDALMLHKDFSKLTISEDNLKACAYSFNKKQFTNGEILNNAITMKVESPNLLYLGDRIYFNLTINTINPQGNAPNNTDENTILPEGFRFIRDYNGQTLSQAGLTSIPDGFVNITEYYY